MCPFKCVKILCRSTPHRSLALDQLRLVNPRIGVLRFGRLVSSERNHTVAVFVNGLSFYTLTRILLEQWYLPPTSCIKEMADKSED